MIPLRKYSYSYLGLLKFIHIACRCYYTLSEVNLWLIQLNGYDLERHKIVIKGLTADNVYQSKIQALRSKELPVELKNRFVSSHTYGEEFRK